MPMIPSPLAALTYGIVKVTGYAAFARQLNQVTGKRVLPYRFGIVKTVLGLAGGLIYVFIFVPFMGLRERGEMIIFLCVLPVRLVVWSIALGIFYGFRENTRRMCIAAAVGTAWSYVLDGVMWFIYLVIPGMVMPFC